MQILSPIPECTISISMREEGNIRGYEDLAQFAHEWGTKTPYMPEHKHGTDVVTITRENLTSPPVSGDIIVTQNKNVVIAHQFADCVPFLCIDRKKKAFVFSHLGWKGLTIGGVQVSILALCAFAHSTTNDLWVWIGPCIQGTSYHFDTTPIQASLPTWQHAIDSEHAIDLPGFIQTECARIGIDPARIINDGRDTAANPELFFSHRRSIEKQEERGVFIVGCMLS